MSAFKLLRRETLYTGKVFQLANETWRGPAGNEFRRQTIVHPGAVAIVAFDRSGLLLLIRQYRTPVRKTLLEIPAGTLEKGEPPLACARRELVEETGCAARNWKRLGAVYTAPGFCNERIVLYKAWDLRPAHAEQDEDEEIEVTRLTRTQVRAAVRRGEICDAKTLSALMHVELLK